MRSKRCEVQTRESPYVLKLERKLLKHEVPHLLRLQNNDIK